MRFAIHIRISAVSAGLFLRRAFDQGFRTLVRLLLHSYRPFQTLERVWRGRDCAGELRGWPRTTWPLALRRRWRHWLHDEESALPNHRDIGVWHRRDPQ